MRTVRTMLLLCLLALAIFLPPAALAEEGGSGHYFPGGTASFIDTVPSKPGLVVGNFFNYYHGSASAGERLPLGGIVAGHLDAACYANSVLALYRTPLQLLGGYYTVGAAVPYVRVRVKANAEVIQNGQKAYRAVRDDADGIGDILLYPFMLGWSELGGDLKSDVRLGIYAPTGNYDKGKLANVGKNYWTFEPAISLSYLGSKNGFEATAFAGIDFNTKNEKTEYQTGTQLHIDATVSQHFPLLGGAVGVGANGFYYQQITGDKGSGAILGGFKGRTAGAGPVASYITKVWQHDLVTEFKWLPEWNTKRRVEGDYIWFKVGMAF